MAGYLGAIPVPQATQHRESFTATSGQTTFNTAGYTVGFLDVYLNGSHLSPADFTATNGSDVVLASGASTGDVCDIISYTAFEVNAQTFTGTTTLTGNLLLGDNDKAIFGAGSDLQIYHDGSDSIIADVGTGHLRLLAEDFRLQDASASETYITAAKDGAVTLRFNDSTKLATTNTGIDVTGAVTADKLNVTHTGGSDFVGVFQNTTSATPYGVHIKDAASGANGYPLLQVTNSAGSSPYFLVHSGTGNVGIGTASPDGRLDVTGSGNTEIYINTGNNSGDNSRIFFGDTADIDVGWLNYDHGTNSMSFGVNATERMRIESSGDLRLGAGGSGPVGPKFYGGTPSTGNNGLSIWPEGDGASSVKQAFYVNNTGARIIVRFINPNGVVGAISTSGSSTSYATSSDYRLKTDAQPMTGASARVQALKPVNFEWISSGERVDGFLAHEAQAVVPECVTGTKDAVGADGKPEYQGIDQSKLVPLLTAALQEAMTRIETLEAKVTALENA